MRKKQRKKNKWMKFVRIVSAFVIVERFNYNAGKD